MTWHRIPPKPAYPLANLPEIPANAFDRPAPGIESALDEERRVAFRSMKALGLNGEVDSELWPYFVAAERDAREHVALMGRIFGAGGCDPITAGFVAAAMLARKMSLASLARGDMKSYTACDKMYQTHMKTAREMCQAAALVRDGKGPLDWDDEPAPKPTPVAIDVEPEPTPAPVEPATEESWHEEVFRRVPKYAITIESNDGTVTHPEPGADPAPSLSDLLGED